MRAHPGLPHVGPLALERDAKALRATGLAHGEGIVRGERGSPTAPRVKEANTSRKNHVRMYLLRTFTLSITKFPSRS